MSRHDRLQRRLDRLQSAMHRSEPREEKRLRKHDSAGSGYSMVALSLGFIAAAVATGNKGLFVPGFILLTLGIVRSLRFALRQKPEASHPHIGMGADIGEGAVIEPGAVVEMGATIEARAVVKRGAVVRMGATVHAGAVIEEKAVVGWGSDIEAEAVVGAGAIVGAGSTVVTRARVPAGLRLAPGATFSLPGTTVVPPSEVDPRRARVESACARIEGELAQMSPTFREHLGATLETATSLKETCLELLVRERALRSEASDESLHFLDTEKAELEKRVAAAPDEHIRKSLQSAMAAIDDQKKQRQSLRIQADRLEAEMTRLQWTLEGMATQLIRLRAAGVDAGQPPSAEVLQTVQQLHQEIDAIAEALEEVRHAESPFQRVDEISSAVTSTRERVSEK